MTKRYGTIATTFGVLVAFLAINAAVADGSTDFTACLNDKGEGELTHVAEGSTPAEPCKKDAHSVTWNSEGPQGFAGPKGDPGIQGEQGIQGKQGIQGETGADGQLESKEKLVHKAKRVRKVTRVQSVHKVNKESKGKPELTDRLES